MRASTVIIKTFVLNIMTSCRFSDQVRRLDNLLDRWTFFKRLTFEVPIAL